MMSEHVPTGTIVRRFLYLNVTCVGEPLVKSVEKPVALVREEETMPEKTHDDPSNSTSFSPLTIWWKSKTRYARSGMKSLSMQSSPIRRQLVEKRVREKRWLLTFFEQSVKLVEERRDMHDNACPVDCYDKNTLGVRIRLGSTSWTTDRPRLLEDL